MIDRVALYRVYDDSDALLYIGISKHFGHRWAEHAETQPWWPEVRRLTVYWYDSREEAETAESAAIKSERPKFNIVHGGDTRREITEKWLNRAGGLAWHLYRMRTAAGLTGHQLASELGWPREKVPRLENGRRPPSSTDIEAWASACGEPEAAAGLVRMLVQYRSDGPGPATPHEAVRQGKRIRNFELAFIPGLLQTAEYARYRSLEAVRVYGFREDGVEAGVAGRMERQSVLYEAGRQFEFIITEAALRFLVCPPEVMLGQLDRLASLSGLASIMLGIIPLDTELAVAPVNGFLAVDDVTYVETHSGWDDVHGEEAAHYGQIADGLMAEALTGDDALRLIAAAAARLRDT